jgi:hypothetical protein
MLNEYECPDASCTRYYGLRLGYLPYWPNSGEKEKRSIWSVAHLNCVRSVLDGHSLLAITGGR